jgi:hypothetical protein
VAKFKLEQSDEILITPTGLVTVGKLLSITSLKEKLNKVKIPDIDEPLIKNHEVLYSYAGLLAQGKVSFDNIEEFRDLDSFTTTMGINNCPASPTLRQRLKKGGLDFIKIIKEETVSLLKTVDPDFNTCYENNVPLDLDDSPFDNSDTKKEGVNRTYKGFDGYCPSFAYLGKEGYLINTKLKEGKAHSMRGAKEFLTQSIDNSKELTDKDILVRMDAGYDSKDILKICQEKKVNFIIKRNLRNNDKDKIIEKCHEKGEITVPRDGKKVYRGSYQKDIPELESPVKVVFDLKETTIDKDGQLHLVPDLELDLYWVNLNAADDEVIELYHKHGTCEQFHSEIKTDMDLERLPSGDFNLNELVLVIGMLVYNILRFMGQLSLQKPDSPLKGGVQRRRVRTVMQNLIMIASKLVSHARQLYLKFGSESPWFKTFRRVYRGCT